LKVFERVIEFSKSQSPKAKQSKVRKFQKPFDKVQSITFFERANQSTLFATRARHREVLRRTQLKYKQSLNCITFHSEFAKVHFLCKIFSLLDVCVCVENLNVYSDPLTEFLRSLFVESNFDTAARMLRECRKVFTTDIFLCSSYNLFFNQARFFYFRGTPWSTCGWRWSNYF